MSAHLHDPCSAQSLVQLKNTKHGFSEPIGRLCKRQHRHLDSVLIDIIRGYQAPRKKKKRNVKPSPKHRSESPLHLPFFGFLVRISTASLHPVSAPSSSRSSSLPLFRSSSSSRSCSSFAHAVSPATAKCCCPLYDCFMADLSICCPPFAHPSPPDPFEPPAPGAPCPWPCPFGPPMASLNDRLGDMGETASAGSLILTPDADGSGKASRRRWA